jgi:hypothetical protein
VGGWRLIVRHGAEVRKDEFEELGEAIEAMRAAVAEVVRSGPLESAQGFREYEPAERVAARLEISTGGILGGRRAGVDVMGDGALVPFSGVVRRHRLDGRSPDRALEAVEGALR